MAHWIGSLINCTTKIRKDHMLHKVMTEKVRLMTKVQRDFALKDIKESMKLHDPYSDYYAKLEAEYDALLEAM